MNIGIIGSGNVGGGGYQIVFTSPTPNSAEMKAVVERAGPNGRAGSVEEAVAASEVL